MQTDMDSLLDANPLGLDGGLVLATLRHGKSGFPFSEQYMFRFESHVTAMREIAMEANP